MFDSHFSSGGVLMRNQACRAVGDQAKWRDQDGFSLMEALVVSMVIAIAVAIALPVATSAISAYNRSIAANRIAECLSSARALAMSENTSITVAFNQANSQYGFDFNGDGIPDTQDPAHPNLSYQVYSMTSSTTISFPINSAAPTGSQNSITFNSRGELPIGTPFPNAQGIKITVNGSSGTATVWVNLRGKVWTTAP
jgi:prepilin-type N-terminal cleavage/methylation domain-containing protein